MGTDIEIQQLVETGVNTAYNSKKTPNPQRSVNIKAFISEEKQCPCLPVWLCKADSGETTFREKQQLPVPKDLCDLLGAGQQPLAAGARGAVDFILPSC